MHFSITTHSFRTDSYKVKEITNSTVILCQLFCFLSIRKFKRKVWEQETREKRRSTRKFGCWKSIATRGGIRRCHL